LYDQEKRYYVYEWFNVETGEVFYVGKGTGRRKTSISTRNPYFKRYYKKHECKVRIVADGLTEEEAYIKENILILAYREIDWAKTNITDGWENPPVLCGEANGMFGKTHTPEAREKLRLANIGIQAGEKNPQYGVSLKERMDEETYNKWIEAHKKAFLGEGNTQYGVSPKERMDEETYLIWAQKQRERKIGKTNPNAKPVSMFDTDGNLIRNFDYMKECAEYLIENGYSKAKKSSKCYGSNLEFNKKK
jgi:hypothetical protein